MVAAVLSAGMRTAIARWTTLGKEPSFLLFALMVIAFITWRAALLDVPFYWDEAWVYAPAVQAMIEHGPSLLPDAIPVDLSRGHPLLFHATAALWGTLFGNGPLALHAFALTVALILLMAVYGVTRSLTNGTIAVATVALVLGHEGFLAQSGLLLPELFLALWMVLALHAVACLRWWTYALFGSLALLTKESALALVAGVLAWAVLGLIRKRGKERLLTLLAALVPAAVLAAFYAVQYGMHGWVFLPDHVDLISLSFKDMAYKARLIFSALFEEQGRLPLGFVLTLLPLALLRRIPLWRRLLCMVLCVAVIKALWGRWPISFVPEPLSSLLLVALIVFLYPIHLNGVQDSPSTRLVVLAWSVVIAFWSLSAMNFYTDRYLMPLLPVIMVGGAMALFTANERWPSWSPVAVLGCCAVLQFAHIGADDKVGDTRLSYLDAIACDQALVDHVNSIGPLAGRITADEMQAFYLSQPAAGYQTTGRSVPVHSPIDPAHSELVILTSNTSGSAMELVEGLDWVSVFRYEQGHAWVEIRRPPRP